MTEVADLTGLKQVVEGIGDQISTAINVGATNRKLASYSHQNLLNNWYFVTPINQRGVSGTTKNQGYFIDQWKLVSGEATLTPDGLLLNGVIQQPRETKVGKTTTATVLTTDGLLNPEKIEYDDDLQIFQITGNGETLVAAKLEVGKYQTLVDDTTDDYVLIDDFNRPYEELKCYRYLQTVWIRQACDYATDYRNINTAIVARQFPVRMRSIPVHVNTNVIPVYVRRYYDGWKTPNEYAVEADANLYIIRVYSNDSTVPVGLEGKDTSNSNPTLGSFLFSAEI